MIQMTRPGQNMEELNPLKQKQAQITIKQAPAPDKIKQQKQKTHTKEELQQAKVSTDVSRGHINM